MVYRCFLGTTLCVFFIQQLVHGLYIKAAFDNVNNPEVGSSTILKCEWKTSEGPENLNFTSHLYGHYYVCDLTDPKEGPKRYPCIEGPAAVKGRYDILSLGEGQISMSIKNLQCSDYGLYQCKMRKKDIVESDHTYLRVKVRPTAPKMSNVRVFSGDANPNITATCTANVAPDEIMWRIYSRSGAVLPPPASFNVSTERLNDDFCEIITRSVAEVCGRTDDKDLVLACFITNTTAQPYAPSECSESGNYLCAFVRAADVKWTPEITSSLPSTADQISTTLMTSTAIIITRDPSNANQISTNLGTSSATIITRDPSQAKKPGVFYIMLIITDVIKMAVFVGLCGILIIAIIVTVLCFKRKS